MTNKPETLQQFMTAYLKTEGLTTSPWLMIQAVAKATIEAVKPKQCMEFCDVSFARKAKEWLG